MKPTDQLSDQALEIVAGGLNPQPLPPGPPPELRVAIFPSFKFNFAAFARTFSLFR